MASVWRVGKSLALALALIVLTSAILVFSDLGSRNRADTTSSTSSGAQSRLRVAFFQVASNVTLDEGGRGVFDGLARHGFSDGGTIALQRFNAEGDMATANAIAKNIVSGNYDLALTVSTIALQTVANANRVAASPVRHVFGLVSDPYGAGVGISADDHLQHPPYLGGVGTLPPVANVFGVLREIRPEIKRVGLLWNPAESNSEAATMLARKVCAELGIELIEGTLDSATAAREALSAVLSRGVEALWISPDTTVLSAADVLIGVATEAGIPAFTSLPGHAAKGALFDVGADYYQVGFAQGEMAAAVLQGQDIAKLPIDNFAPEELHVNENIVAKLRGDWSLPVAVRDRAVVRIDASGQPQRAASANPASAQK